MISFISRMALRIATRMRRFVRALRSLGLRRASIRLGFVVGLGTSLWGGVQLVADVKKFEAEAIGQKSDKGVVIAERLGEEVVVYCIWQTAPAWRELGVPLPRKQLVLDLATLGLNVDISADSCRGVHAWPGSETDFFLVGEVADGLMASSDRYYFDAYRWGRLHAAADLQLRAIAASGTDAVALKRFADTVSPIYGDIDGYRDPKTDMGLVRSRFIAEVVRLLRKRRLIEEVISPKFEKEFYVGSPADEGAPVDEGNPRKKSEMLGEINFRKFMPIFENGWRLYIYQMSKYPKRVDRNSDYLFTQEGLIN
jgi:hypothetical protein